MLSLENNVTIRIERVIMERETNVTLIIQRGFVVCWLLVIILAGYWLVLFSRRLFGCCHFCSILLVDIIALSDKLKEKIIHKKYVLM